MNEETQKEIFAALAAFKKIIEEKPVDDQGRITAERWIAYVEQCVIRGQTPVSFEEWYETVCVI